jgi:hypothetical protein
MIGLAALALAQASPQNPFSSLFPPLCPQGAARCGSGTGDSRAVPACPNRASDSCEPWERDWSTARTRETDYFEVGVGDDGSRWSVQNLSIIRARGRAEPEIWVQVDNSAVRDSRARSVIFLVKMQCAALRMGTLSSVRYDATGNIISEENVRPSAVRYSYAVPGTISSVILRTACGG